MSESDVIVLVSVIGAIILIPVLILTLLYVIGLWKVLKKGGKPGWGSLIPFYGQYLLCEMTGVNPWWIVIVACAAFVPVFGSALASFSGIYFSVILSMSLAKSFGKEEGFGIGLILLAPVFYLILGCGKDEYLGPNPIRDVIFESITNKEKKTSSKSTSSTKFCVNCGNEIPSNARFCSRCGKKVK